MFEGRPLTKYTILISLPSLTIIPNLLATIENRKPIWSSQCKLCSVHEVHIESLQLAVCTQLFPLHYNVSLCIKFCFVCNKVTSLIKYTELLCTVQHCKVTQYVSYTFIYCFASLCTISYTIHFCTVFQCMAMHCTAPMHLSPNTAVRSNLSTFCFHELIHKDLASRANIFINHLKMLHISK